MGALTRGARVGLSAQKPAILSGDGAHKEAPVRKAQEASMTEVSITATDLVKYG
jgi:hypothetical protein